jgi:hypothetical protein
MKKNKVGCPPGFRKKNPKEKYSTRLSSRIIKILKRQPNAARYIEMVVDFYEDRKNDNKSGRKGKSV